MWRKKERIGQLQQKVNPREKKLDLILSTSLLVDKTPDMPETQLNTMLVSEGTDLQSTTLALRSDTTLDSLDTFRPQAEMMVASEDTRTEVVGSSEMKVQSSGIMDSSDEIDTYSRAQLHHPLDRTETCRNTTETHMIRETRRLPGRSRDRIQSRGI
jgi:hypothetical protein